MLFRNLFRKTGTARRERWHVNSTTPEADEGRGRLRDIAGHEARSAPAQHLLSVNGALVTNVHRKRRDR